MSTLASARCAQIPRLAALTVVLIAGIVLIGWWLELEAFKRVYLGQVQMKANTALGLMLAGIALWVRAMNCRRPALGYRLVAYGLAATVLLLGLLTIGEYALDRDFGIDQLLARELAGYLNTSPPGRMAQPTALAFVLAASALLLIDCSWRVSALLAVSTLAVGVLGATSYLFGLPAEQVRTGHVLIAQPTAISFVLLGIGFLFLQPQHGVVATFLDRHSGGVVARRLLPAVLLVPLVTSGLVALNSGVGLFLAANRYSLAFGTQWLVVAGVILWLGRHLNQSDTEREQVQQALAHSAERFRALVSNAADVIAILDADLRIQYVSPAINSLVGLLPSDLPWVTGLPPIHPDDDVAVRQLLAGLLDTPGATARAELRVRHQDGTWRWVDVVFSNHLADPAILGIVANLHDVTARKRSELLLKQAVAAAEEGNRLKSEFLSTMSHELRTPMTAIIGYSRLLLDGVEGELNERQLADIAQIERSADHLLLLINDVLDLARIEAGRLELSIQSVDITQVVVNVCEAVRPRAEEKAIALTIDEAPSPLFVAADPMRLHQILLNLVGNAIKFTLDGGITVEVAEDEHEVAVHVADTGIGIAAGSLSIIFDEFRQADGSTSRRFGGTGLGLAISRQLAEAQNGTISVQSTLDVGSTFTLRLPRATQVITADAATTPRSVPSKWRLGVGSAPVLLVEDDLHFADIVRRELGNAGIDVVLAERGDEAIAMARSLLPSLILLDIILPGEIDGWQVLRTLRTDPTTIDIPITMVSALHAQGYAATLGATDYLVKPLDRGALLASVNRLGTAPPAEILVVDDDPVARDLLTRMLDPNGYTVRTARDGVEALNEMTHHCPDLVLLDLMMPEADGFTVLETLRANPATRYLPVIIVTAQYLTEAQAAWLHAKTASVLAKTGLRAQELLLEVRTALLSAPELETAVHSTGERR